VLGEDQRSTDKNIELLQAEMKKAKPDKAIVADKMKRTVAHRQSMALERPTADVIETFPSLRMSLFVSTNTVHFLLARYHASTGIASAEMSVTDIIFIKNLKEVTPMTIPGRDLEWSFFTSVLSWDRHVCMFWLSNKTVHVHESL